MKPLLELIPKNSDFLKEEPHIRLLLEETALRKIHQKVALSDVEREVIHSFFTRYVTHEKTQKALRQIHSIGYLEEALYATYETCKTDEPLKGFVDQNRSSLWKPLMAHYRDFQNQLAGKSGLKQGSPEHKECLSLLEKVTQLTALDDLKKDSSLCALGQWIEASMQRDTNKFFLQ
jgi:hypothetical protein